MSFPCLVCHRPKQECLRTLLCRDCTYQFQVRVEWQHTQQVLATQLYHQQQMANKTCLKCHKPGVLTRESYKFCQACYAKRPMCQALNCKARVSRFLIKRQEWVMYCGTCKCIRCEDKAGAFSTLCVQCQSHEDAQEEEDQRQEQAEAVVESLVTEQPTKNKKDGLLRIEPVTVAKLCKSCNSLKSSRDGRYKYCKTCRCRSAHCQELASSKENGYCGTCLGATKQGCSSAGCTRLIPAKYQYCWCCHEQYNLGRVLCSTPKCGSYCAVKDNPNLICDACFDLACKET